MTTCVRQVLAAGGTVSASTAIFEDVPPHTKKMLKVLIKEPEIAEFHDDTGEEALDEEETFGRLEEEAPFNVNCEEVSHGLEEETLEVRIEEEDAQEAVDEGTADRCGWRGSRTRQDDYHSNAT